MSNDLMSILALEMQAYADLVDRIDYCNRCNRLVNQLFDKKIIEVTIKT